VPETPIVGPTYKDKSLDINAQKTVNCYVDMYKDPSSGEDMFGLYQIPGTELWKHLANGQVRCSATYDGKGYVVIGATAYQVQSDKTSRYLGTLQTTSGRISTAFNGTHVVFVDGPYGYYYNIETDVWADITDSAFYGATHVVFADGFFVFNRPNTGQWYWPKSSYTVEPFDGLNFATAESLPDQLEAIVAYRNILFFFGEDSMEPWNYTGKTLPWSPMRQSFHEWGVAAKYTPIVANNTIFWLARDVRGQLQFKSMEGVVPSDVSTSALVNEWQSFTTVDDAFTLAFQMDNHDFIVLTFPTENRTYIYDASMKLWFEAGEWNTKTGSFDRLRMNTHMVLGNEHIVGDYKDGRLYKMASSLGDFAGKDMICLRRGAHMHNSRMGFAVNNLRLNGATGYGVPNASTVLYLAARCSKDRGRTWSSSRNQSIGAVGNYALPIEFRQWGFAHDIMFEVSWNGKAHFALRNGFVEVDLCGQ